MNAITTNNLTKKYHNKIVVNNLNFDVKNGEFLALLGFNGAGKTTTIKMLSGLTKVTSGDALIFEKSILTDMDKIKTMINISPQDTAVAPNLTVYDNLVFVARIYGFSKTEAKEKAEALIKKFDLVDKAKEKAKTLSGGLMRRLSIAMALISDPKIIFLDEPTLGLDVRSRKELWKILEELKDKITIILTTHYLEEVMALADTIAIIDKGVLKVKGTIEELKNVTNLNNLEDIFLKLTEGNIDE